MRRTRSVADAWNRFWFEPGPAVRLGLARAAFCIVAFFFYLPHDFSEWATATPFWMPIWTFQTLHLPVVSSASLVVAQAVWKGALALSGLGLFTRASTLLAAILGTYLLGLPHNFGATQHYDTLVVFVLWILVFSRAGDARSLDALRARARGEARRPSIDGEYTWPIRALWVLTALMFFGAGTSKLRHSGLEWALSDNLRLLLIRAYYHVSDGDPLTSLGLVVAKHAWLSRAIASSALALETLYIVTLFSRRLRPIVGCAGMFFFIGIRTLMGPTFEPYLICGLFLVPWHRVEAAVLGVLSQSVEPMRPWAERAWTDGRATPPVPPVPLAYTPTLTERSADVSAVARLQIPRVEVDGTSPHSHTPAALSRRPA